MPRRRRTVVAAGVAIVVLGVVLAVRGAGVATAQRLLGPGGVVGDGPALGHNRQDARPALAAPDGPGHGRIAVATADRPVPGPRVEVVVEPPPGAKEMQIGFDASFRSVPWVPVAADYVLEATDVGYRTIFGRFRTGVGETPSPVSVTAVTVDPTYEAAVASADGRHRVSWVRPLTPSAVVVRIETGRIDRGGVERYDFDDPPPGDEVGGGFGLGGRRRSVDRNGVRYGRQLDGYDEYLRVFDRSIGRPLDIEALLEQSWMLLGIEEGDQQLPSPMSPVSIDRISRADGAGTDGDGAAIAPVVHDLVLRFERPIEPGRNHQLRPPAELVEPVTFAFDRFETVSPAVHVNQGGYGTDDRLKIGYLAGYPDDLGGTDTAYRSNLAFVVVETGDTAETGDTSDTRVVYEGRTTARPTDHGLEHGDLTGAAVYELDFSSVVDPGRYQVCVDTVGCSEPFEIDDDVWLDLAVGTARAMYHQRSGIALGPPYTSVARPRPYHPEDGLVVRESSHRLLDTPAVPAAEGFAALSAAGTDREVAEAWGGHFDAGDWDRRIEHLYYVRTVAELVERHPDPFAMIELQLPESGDETPDLLDEGLWTLDLFRRLQRDDGAISGGVEAAEHPLAESVSWTDTLEVFTYEPDPWSTYLYAGVAAQVAVVLSDYDEERADDYLDSAVAAMEWAEAQPVEAGTEELIAGNRSVAAVALYGATGEDRWHEAFLTGGESGAEGRSPEGADPEVEVDRFLSCHEHTRCDAWWLYLNLDESMTDPERRASMVASFRATADEIVDAADATAFGWTLENRFVPLVWGLGVGGAPKVAALVRAHELTGDPRYLAATQRSTAVSLGANPTNTVYVTGVGQHPVRHPLVVDNLYGGLPVWPGTPVYGTHELGALRDEGWVEEFVLGPAGVDPLPSDLPYLWQWSDTPRVPMFNEFTVFQSHAQALYAFASLAAHS